MTSNTFSQHLGPKTFLPNLINNLRLKCSAVVEVMRFANIIWIFKRLVSSFLVILCPDVLSPGVFLGLVVQRAHNVILSSG